MSLRETTKVSPTVRRIVSVLRERILSDEYVEGDWLPAERLLADEFQVSRIPVRSAIKELEREGLILCDARHRPRVRLNPAARRAETAVASRSIALWIWPQHNWPGSALIIRGIQEALGEEFRLVLGGATGVPGRRYTPPKRGFCARYSATGTSRG